MIGLPVLRCCPRRRLLLTESELTETKAFIRSFVKQVAVAPGRVTGPLHRPHARRQLDTWEVSRKGGLERVCSTYFTRWWA